jgi:hypothetical protein
MPAGFGMSNGLLEDAIDSGDIQKQAQLSPLFADAQYNGKLRNGYPPGAVEDSRSPLGFYIADPKDREAYSNSQAKLASGVANQSYMDDFYRDRHKNTMEMLKVASGLEPDLQAIIFDKLGLRPPKAPIDTEGMSPTNAYAVQRGLEPGPSAGAMGSYIPGIGGAQGGMMSSKLREALALAQQKHTMDAPERQANREIREGQLMINQQQADSNYLLRREQQNMQYQAQQNQKLAHLDRMEKALTMIRQEIQYAPDPASKLDAQQRAMGLSSLYMKTLNELNATDLQGGGGGPPDPSMDQQPQVQPGNAPMGQQRAWWDQAMPTDVAPVTKVNPQLLARLQHYQKYNPGDIGAQQHIVELIRREQLQAASGESNPSNISSKPVVRRR